MNQAIRKIDLLGMTLAETNIERVNEQLAAMNRAPVTGFHHEVVPLSDGNVATLAGVEQILTDVQGEGEVNVLGDTIIVLDREMNVVWAWDSFDWLDPARAAILGEVCIVNGPCPPYYKAPSANDWTHGNALTETPDGNLLFSIRHLDWLVKVDYAHAQGDGHILWRFGKDGDFHLDSRGTWDWFSHQHDGGFDPSMPNHLLVYDNGNTRVGQEQRGNSRGQVYEVDEDTRTARLVLNADLGLYSQAVGSAQRLGNGNYYFCSGYVIENGKIVTYNGEVSPAGQTVYQAKANTLVYRSFRLPDIYTPAGVTGQDASSGISTLSRVRGRDAVRRSGTDQRGGHAAEHRTDLRR